MFLLVSNGKWLKMRRERKKRGSVTVSDHAKGFQMAGAHRNQFEFIWIRSSVVGTFLTHIKAQHYSR